MIKIHKFVSLFSLIQNMAAHTFIRNKRQFSTMITGGFLLILHELFMLRIKNKMFTNVLETMIIR